MKVSAVIITLNEERNISRCIQSLLPVADEIIVVDSFSTDATKNICSRFPVIFSEHIFEGHIQQKNYAMNITTNEYVLSLDADEALSETLQKNILALKKSTIIADAYCMNRLTNYCGEWIKHSGWYPDTKIRLWNKNKGMWGGLNPHDKVVMQNNSTIEKLNGDILHYSYYTVAEHYQQADKFATIAAKAYYENGNRSSYLHILFSPILKFCRNYILKMGFLDGKAGFIISKISALETYWKYKRLFEMKK